MDHMDMAIWAFEKVGASEAGGLALLLLLCCHFHCLGFGLTADQHRFLETQMCAVHSQTDCPASNLR
jgi:hypothetical protein